MTPAIRWSAIALLGVAALMAQLDVAAATSHRQLMSPASPQIQQVPRQMSPRLAPGTPQQMAPGGPGIVLRTHCNGTCMCTGSDCNDTWTKTYCKDEPVCSSDPGDGNLVCSCVKKAAQ
jgi:hypothetical protein